MDLRIFVEPQQGASYDDLLAIARATRAAGFSGFFRSDHLLVMGDGSGLPGPSDAFITLAALAREVPDIRLGTLVTAATFRAPGLLAIQAAGIDQMSGGRLDLGMGAGWFQQEHEAYGLDFGDSMMERFDRMEEQLAILTGLWAAQAPFSFQGKHYQLTNAPGLPKPVQHRTGGVAGVPIIIGGHGKRRTPRLAAEYADEFNVAFSDLEVTVTQFERVRQACTDTGRDPAELTYSAAQVACVGRDEAEIARRAAAIGREVGELRENGIAGTVAEAAAKLRTWRDAGVQRVYLQVLDLSDLDHVALLAELLDA